MTTVGQVQDAKKALERDIAVMIQDFMDAYNVLVDQVDLDVLNASTLGDAQPRHVVQIRLRAYI